MKPYIDFVYDHPEVDLRDLEEIRRLVTGGRILDIGCGSGSFLQLVARDKRYRGEGIDNDSQSVVLCRQKGLTVSLADGRRTKFKAGSFEIVRTKEVIEHIPEPEQLVKESYRLLKPGGYLLLHTPTQYSTLYPLVNFWDDYTHIRPFTKQALRRLLGKCGFEIVSLGGYTIGRNRWENIVAEPLGWIFPFEWRVIARKG